MSRVRAEALVLVNWKGVFYERYELDPHVTALEGDNGAGKTTVMIGAYVVLLPDMTRLRFTNLGETGATGGDKGIWGRLGEVGRPSYAALDFRLPRGERVLAGVHLERKGEPTVEPSPFLATGLADDVRLQDLLLLAQGELELVPELPELRDNAARLGGRLQTFTTARDYFAALFERGITPMRLGTDEQRNKLNEMLKTSMTGGMSRGLLQELRSFLLKQEGGLAETLKRMRANLDACRRTRTEVLEAQRLEQEIGSVYEAGEEMFAAAIAATRQRAEEMTRRVTEKEAARHQAEEAANRARTALEETQQAVQAAVDQKESVGRALSAAASWERRVADAVDWQRKLEERDRELSLATAARDEAERARDAAQGALDLTTEAVSNANDARERAAAGLADFNQGLEELHRRAAAHTRVSEQLARARQALETPDLDPEDATPISAQARASLEAVDHQRRELGRRISDATVHREEHGDAMRALGRILDVEVLVEGALNHARQALASVSRWEASARRRDELRGQVAEVEADSRRQESARERARRLAIEWEAGDGRASVGRALEAVEGAITQATDRAQAADAAAKDADRILDETAAEIRALDARAARWRDLAGTAQRIGEHLDVPLEDRADLAQARTSVREQLGRTGNDLDEVTATGEALLAEARQLLNAGGTFPDELLRIRDELTADLLASHFDDVDVEEAAELEARLGPLAEALVVEDIDEATRRLGNRDASLPTVWLVHEDAALSLDPDQVVERAGERDVVVDEGEGRRLTRIPDRPTLGRAAREHRATTLRQEATGLESRIDELRSAKRHLESLQQAADTLLEGVEIWLLGDPAAELHQARKTASEAQEAGRTARADAKGARVEADGLRHKRSALLELLPDAALLDAPDQAERLGKLREELDEAIRAGENLRRIGDAPFLLEQRLDALRQAPWSETEVDAARGRLAMLEARRDALADGLEALAYVAENKDALAWTDATRELARKEGLVPALRSQLEQAKAAVTRAQQAEEGARHARDAASEAFNEAHGEHAMAKSRRDEAARQLAELDVADPDEALLAEARSQLAEAREAHGRAEKKLGELQTDVGRRESEARAASALAEVARTAENDERRQARPAQEAWDKLKPQVEEANLLDAALSERFHSLFGGWASVRVSMHAQNRRDLLLERLRTAHGGTSVLDEVERWLEGSDQTIGEGYLGAWLIVRDWLRSRLPAQIAEVDEPLEALERFRDHLSGLFERLERQEHELRGASEDVARGIDVQIRKANGRVKRLNKHLDGVSFGSIRGIRVRMKRVERMEQILRALRSGEAQDLLFQAGMPVEQALEEIFRRFGGGRTGGQRLLDYREYIHLHVEVLRTGSPSWELANPTRLSTGEAIGVGAALMMVVLTEWERDANLLRGKRSFGSMRFLFLDEANRLDQANLGTVFDLCRNLDLQLLVAAPEVARAEGCTVFRLVRTRTEDGQEQVLVSGRRVIAGEA
jgi:chromosome partition protein MukB